jgi:hypothetical protein
VVLAQCRCSATYEDRAPPLSASTPDLNARPPVRVGLLRSVRHRHLAPRHARQSPAGRKARRPDRFYAKPKLLVVDELGYLPLEKQTAHLFFQLVSRRYERGSLLLTTNQTITRWGHFFGDETIASAVLDRVLHHSHVLMIQGDSF